MSDEQQPDPRPGDYFVSAIDGDRYSLISGPYVNDHAAALADVASVRRLANDHDPRACFWAWGTCRMEPNSGRIGTAQKCGLLPAPGVVIDEPACV